MKRSIATFLTVLLALTAFGASGALAQNAGSSGDPAAGVTVIPPTEDPLGVPYSDWAGRWYAWLLSATPAEYPGGVDNCQFNQGGEVFFIPHVSGGVTLETHCTVGVDQHILAMAGGQACTPDPGDTDQDVLDCVQADLEGFSAPSVTIDGQVVPDIESFWVSSPIFDLELPEDNLFGTEAGTVSAASVGWFVMIPPLPEGAHTIEVSDAVDYADDEEGPLTATLTALVQVGAPEESPAG